MKLFILSVKQKKIQTCLCSGSLLSAASPVQVDELHTGVSYTQTQCFYTYTLVLFLTDKDIKTLKHFHLFTFTFTKPQLYETRFAFSEGNTKTLTCFSKAEE